MPGTEQLDQDAPSKVLEREQIPNIDLAPLFNGSETERQALVSAVRDACLDPGFFYIHNSCVSNAVISDAQAAMERFFAYPDDHPMKLSVHNRNHGFMKGWGPMFEEPAYQPGTVAYLESFDLGQQLSEDQYQRFGIEPNAWPQLAGFCEAILAYYEAVTGLGRALSKVFSELLGEAPDFINNHSSETAPRTMRLLHYPENDGKPDPHHVGISAHTDFECFTIMNQTAEGLELTRVDGDWYKAPADIGTFTVIIGDMLERFSNGQFKATGHRVVNTPWKRYSMVLFFALDGAFSISPLPQFVSREHPDCYGPVTQDEHIRVELERATQNANDQESRPG